MKVAMAKDCELNETRGNTQSSPLLDSWWQEMVVGQKKHQ